MQHTFRPGNLIKCTEGFQLSGMMSEETIKILEALPEGSEAPWIPIPFNDEYLQNLGFKRETFTCEDETEFECWEHSKYPLIRVCDNRVFNGSEELADIKYVHDFQNLFADLKAKSLKEDFDKRYDEQFSKGVGFFND